MTISREEYFEGKTKLLEVLKQWDHSGPLHRSSDKLQADRTAFDKWEVKIKAQGWSRNDVYELIHDISGRHSHEFQGDAIEQLLEYETGITGFCAHTYIVRFPGDPTGVDALAEHVLGNKWRKEPPNTPAELVNRYAKGDRIFLNLGAEQDFEGNLQNADLHDALLSGIIVIDFSNANLMGAGFVGNIKTSVFRNANCAGARFQAAIDGCDFGGANLEGANFEGSSFQSHIFKRGERP